MLFDRAFFGTLRMYTYGLTGFTGPVNPSDFDRMVADSMKDLNDEDISDTEDPELMVTHV